VTFVLLIILAVVWAVYLVSWARSRTEHRSVNSISTFNKHLSVLERTTPGRSSAPTRIAGSPAPQRTGVSLARPAFAPTAYRGSGGIGMSRRQARERRKNVLFALAGAALVTLALTVLLGGPFLYLQLLTDALLVGYVLLLVQTQRMAAERQSKVRYLQQPAEYHEPAAPLLLRSSVN
jgi:hypothetical protein